jgi:GNAT superfamily N-acetyltransferase
MSAMVIIRETQLEDAPDITALVTQLGYPVAPEEMRDRLARLMARPDHVVFVAESSNCIVGLVGVYLVDALEFSGKYGRLTGMVVDENWRGRGIGRLLMDWIESWLIEQGARMLILTSGSQRSEAHQFYRHLGYAETGLRFAKLLG